MYHCICYKYVSVDVGFIVYSYQWSTYIIKEGNYDADPDSMNFFIISEVTHKDLDEKCHENLLYYFQHTVGPNWIRCHTAWFLYLKDILEF